jgi:hypothetical protein
MRYLCYQQETCPTSGRLHWQGAIWLRKTATRSAVKVLLDDEKAHLEETRGSTESAIEYTRKEETAVAGTWREHGRRPTEDRQPGRSCELQAVADMCVAGATITSIAQAQPITFIRYSRGIMALLSALSAPRDRAHAVEVHVILGPTGCGKTRVVWDECELTGLFCKRRGKWWDGYTGQPTVLFDDFRGEDDMSPSELLAICDRYPLRVELKGGWVQLGAGRIVFTSNCHPDAWYHGTRHRYYWTEPETRNAWIRRVTHTRNYFLDDGGAGTGASGVYGAAAMRQSRGEHEMVDAGILRWINHN